MKLNARYKRIAGAVCVALLLLLGAPGESAAQERITRESQLIEILESGATAQEKDKACRELQVLGTPASIPALAALLADKELSHMARYALEPMPYPQAGLALRQALAQTSGLIQVGIINSLAFRAEKDAAPDLINLLKDPDVEVAGAAAAALGRIATTDAIQALERFRATATAPLQGVAAEASLTAAERLLRDGRSPAAVKIYEQMQQAKWPVSVRQGAFAGLLKALPNEAAARITRAIKGNDPVLKIAAIAGIPAMKDPGAVERISSMLPGVPSETQVLLIGVLADCESKSVLPAIEKALASPNQEVKLAAVKALGIAGNSSSVSSLCKILTDSNPDTLKKEAVRSLERIRGEGVHTELRNNLRSAPADVKVLLIGILVSRSATEALGDLLQQTGYGDSRVRIAALKPVGNWGGSDLLPTIIGILKGWKEEEGRTEIELAAVRLARKIPNKNNQADAVIEALNAATDTPVKCSLLRVLGGIANDRALAAMRTALESGTPEVKEAALNTLINWPDASAIDLLLAQWRKGGDPTQKTLILRSCVKLLRRGEDLPGPTVARYRELLSGAQGPEEKILVFSGLAEVGNPSALELVEPSLRDPQVKAEAELCMIQVARRVIGSDPKAAKRAAGKLSTDAQSEELRKQAVEMVRQIEQSEDYLMTWQVAGSYSRPWGEKSALLDIIFPPEKALPSAQWRDLPIRNRAARAWMLDLAGFLRGSGMRTAYARTWLYSEKAQNASLELGIDDPVKVWLNSGLIHLHNIPAPSALVKDQMNISLKPGWNLLLLKIVQTAGPWEFSVKLRKPDGGPLDGVRYDANYGEKSEVIEPK